MMIKEANRLKMREELEASNFTNMYYMSYIGDIFAYNSLTATTEDEKALFQAYNQGRIELLDGDGGIYRIRKVM